MNKRVFLLHALFLFLIINPICAFAQKAKHVKRKHITKEIKESKEAHYSFASFSNTPDEIKEGIKEFFDKNKSFMYCGETYNAVFYSGNATARYSDTYNQSLGPQFDNESNYALRIYILNNEAGRYYIQTDEGYDITGNAQFYNYSLRSPFRLNNLVYFLNDKFKGAWQPDAELMQKITVYNDNVKNKCKMLIRGKDY